MEKKYIEGWVEIGKEGFRFWNKEKPSVPYLKKLGTVACVPVRIEYEVGEGME